MAPLLQLLSMFMLLSLSHSESKGGPRVSVCDSDNKGLIPKWSHGERKSLDEKEYEVTVTLLREKDNKPVDCVDDRARRYIVRINATKHFKGFIITSTEPGTGYPANFVGKFHKKPHEYKNENLIHLCENAVAHKDILKRNPVELRWRSSIGGKETEFLYTVVFDRYTWLANLTTRFPVCKPQCIARVEPDMPAEESGSGFSNTTNTTTANSTNTTTDLSPAGSALLESKCELVKTKLEPRIYTVKVGGNPVDYHCTVSVTRCSGECTYCDQGCESVHSKMEKPLYDCVTMDENPHIRRKQLFYRAKEPVQVDKECRCLGKYDADS